MWSRREVRTWVIEVGVRAALHTEVMPRDMRWWRGLRWERWEDK